MLPGCRSSDFFCRVHLPVAVSTASTMSLAMLRGLLVDFCFSVIGLLSVVGENDRAFSTVRVLDIGGCQMQRADHRLTGIGSDLGQRVFQPLAGRSEGAERVVDPGAPVGTGNELAREGGTIFRQSRLMQPESKLDDVGNAVAGHAFAGLILEGINVAALCQKPLLKMLNTDDAKMLGVNRLAAVPHRDKQLGDTRAVDLVNAEELRQRLVRTTYIGQYPALNGRPGEPAKLGNELAHRAVLRVIAISGYMCGEITLQ